tara:strand:- start:75 stop:332 length:258 start_codon:yes stop_codon:yes gene_type:complete
MKTLTENGTKKYLVQFIGKPYLIPSFEDYKESFIKNEIYKVFKMNNGEVIIEGKYINELNNVKTCKRNFNYSKEFYKNNFKYKNN